MDPEDLLRYHSWACREEHFDQEKHDVQIDALEKDWPNFSGQAHQNLCGIPAYLENSIAASGLWQTGIPLQEAIVEGHAWKAKYFHDAQFVLSRTNHHVHTAVKKGDEIVRVPLAACKKKNSKDGLCKGGFPMHKQLNKGIGRKRARVRVICRGNATKFGQKVWGRRNALGSLLGVRSCPWICGTTPGFAVVFRSNTNVMPNMRLPILVNTHDDENCKRRGCVVESDVRRLTMIVSRAGRQQTGYFTGHICKRQPVGKYELDNCLESMRFLTLRQESEDVSNYVAKAQRCNRIISDLYVRGTLRTSQEDTSINVNMHDHDVLQAESLRTFRSADFYGSALLERLEAASRKHRRQGHIVTVTRVPVNANPSVNRFEAPVPSADCYGYRGDDPRVFYLSPWEFIILWSLEKLQPPPWYERMYRKPLTAWTVYGLKKYETCVSDALELEPGTDYLLIDNNLGPDALTYPDIPSMQYFRHAWYLMRNQRPTTPQPMHSPMPDKRLSKEQNARVYSI